MERPIYYDKISIANARLYMPLLVVLSAFLAFAELRSANVLGIVYGSIFTAAALAMLFPTLGILLRNPKKPAIVVLDEGLLIDNLPFESALALKWSDIACVYEVKGWICVMPADPVGFEKSLSLFTRMALWCVLLSCGSCLAVSATTVDITWEQFAESVLEYVNIGRMHPGVGIEMISTPDKWQEERIAEIRASIEDLLTVGGKLSDIRSYEAHFWNDLIGVWSTDEGMPSPIDKSVAFNEDGSGAISAAFFNGFSGEFQWRRVAQRRIEIRELHSEAQWTEATWTFEQASDAPRLRLACDPGGALAYELDDESFSFGGLPVGSRESA